MKTRHQTLSLAIAGLAFLGLTPGTLSAQESDVKPPHPPSDAPGKDGPRQDRMQHARAKAAELESAGKPDEARKLRQRIEAERDKQGGRPMSRDAKRDEPTRAAPDRQRTDGGKPVMPAKGKIQHLRQAAEHLKVAGYEKEAGKAMAEVKRLESELPKSNAVPNRERASDPAAAIRMEFMKIHKEMEALRREVMQLKARPDGRGNPSQEMRRPWTGRPEPSSDERRR